MRNWPSWAWAAIVSTLIVAVPLIAVAAFVGTATTTFPFLFSVLIVVILAGFAAVVLGKMVTNDINLQYLISEDNGYASLSRFQFLLFTFVIAASYFLFVASLVTKFDASALLKDGKPIPLPDIPGGVLGLIGISGASYVVAKGIQKSAKGSGVVSIHITNGGTAYTSVPGITIAGGGGAGAQARAFLSGNAIDHIDVTTPGSDYTSTPTVQINGGGGTGATAVAELG